MIDFKKAPLHPTNEELADFIDNRVIGTRKQEIEEHLLFCDDCMGVVAEVKRVSKDDKSTTSTQQDSDIGLGYANNWLYSERVRAIVLSGLVASVVVIFMLSPFSSTQFNIGEIDLSKPIMTTMGSSSKYQNRVVDGDKVVKEIEESLDLTSIKSFLKAEEAEKRGDFKLALDLYYDNAFEEVLNRFESEEQLKWKIVIYYRISRINFQEGIEDNESYKNYTKAWIQEYILNRKVEK